MVLWRRRVEEHSGQVLRPFKNFFFGVCDFIFLTGLFFLLLFWSWQLGAKVLLMRETNFDISISHLIHSTLVGHQSGNERSAQSNHSEACRIHSLSLPSLYENPLSRLPSAQFRLSAR